MNSITFIVGGARSGKSSYAIELAKGRDKKVAFIATCQPLDKEMKLRIELHKKKRPGHWKTFEEPKDLEGLLKRLGAEFDIVIIDCLTLFISNLLSKGLSDEEIEGLMDKISKILKAAKYKSIIISNEVGLGIVPRNRIARRFRDLAGKINQKAARNAEEVIFMVSGIPLSIKGGKGWLR